MRELAFQSARTQEELQLLSREMRELKDEMAELMEVRNPPGFPPRRWQRDKTDFTSANRLIFAASPRGCWVYRVLFFS